MRREYVTTISTIERECAREYVSTIERERERREYISTIEREGEKRVR